MTYRKVVRYSREGKEGDDLERGVMWIGGGATFFFSFLKLKIEIKRRKINQNYTRNIKIPQNSQFIG